MNMNDYQELARRTVNANLAQHEMINHALFGMCGELGEIQSLFQKEYQGHEFDKAHLFKELGDLLWFMSELCTAYGVELEQVAQTNIKKLMARYPEGFKEEQSKVRKAGDI